MTDSTVRTDSPDRIADALAMVETSAQMVWVGASAGFAFVSAPLAFRAVPDLDAFATLTERSLARLGTLSLASGGVAMLAAAGRALRPGGGAADVARILETALALAFVAYQRRVVMPAMATAQRAMGGLEEVPHDDPRRVAYRTLHATSTRVYGAGLMLGTIACATSSLRATGTRTREAETTHLDHLVLTVADPAATSAWYARVLGMEPITFGEGRSALRFGRSKINLHRASPASTNGVAPGNVAKHPTPGSADLCFVTRTSLVDVLAHLHDERVPIETGPIARSGARRPLSSIYVRDPDGNLVEIANER